MAWAIVRKWWAVGLAFLGLVGTGVAYVLLGKKEHEGDDLANALENAKRRAETRMVNAQAKAAIEIYVARKGDTQAAAQVQAILQEPDEAQRGEMLQAMARRLRSQL